MIEGRSGLLAVGIVYPAGRCEAVAVQTVHSKVRKEGLDSVRKRCRVRWMARRVAVLVLGNEELPVCRVHPVTRPSSYGAVVDGALSGEAVGCAQIVDGDHVPVRVWDGLALANLPDILNPLPVPGTAP